MDSQYSGTDKQTSDKEKILAIFENVGIGSDSVVFDRFVQSDEGQQMLKNNLYCGGEMTEPRRINYLEWIPLENNTNPKRRTAEFGITCLVGSTRFEEAYRKFATVSLLDSAVQDVKIGYSNGMITFKPIYYSGFRVVCEGGKLGYGNFSDIDTNIDYFFSDLFPIPLPIFVCWLKGNMEDPSSGIQIEASDDNFLTYQAGKYPTELYRWASGKGQGALDILLEEKFMNKESYDIIKKRISSQMEVKVYSSSSTLLENYADKANTLAREPTSFAKGLGDVQPSGHPHGPSPQEIQRLATIGNHEGSVQNYISWGKLLGYSGKSSVHDFLKKMEEMDILTIEKTPHGTRINLTPYGKQLAIGWQARDNS